MGRKPEQSRKHQHHKRYYKTKTKCQNPRRLYERQPRSCVARASLPLPLPLSPHSHSHSHSGPWHSCCRSPRPPLSHDGGRTFSALSPFACVCAQRAQSRVFIGDCDCGLAYPHTQAHAHKLLPQPASRRNESKQANKQMRHQSCH